MYAGTSVWLDRLLPRLEELWQAQSAPIANCLAVGATPDALAELQGRSGVVIPPELQVLWQWHDGSQRPDDPSGLPFFNSVIAGGWQFLSAEEAVAERDWRVSLFVPESYADDPHEWHGWWDPHWLPFARMDAYALFVDGRQVTPAGTVPVRYYAHTPEDPFTPVAGSVAILIGLWVEALERRYNWWSTDPPGWHYDWDAVPDYMKSTHAIG